MTPKGLTHKAGLNTGTHYFFCVRWDLFGSPALSTLRRRHNHWPRYGIASVYTWTLFTVPQSVPCTGRSVPQHKAIWISHKPTWQCDQRHWSTFYQIMSKKWLFYISNLPTNGRHKYSFKPTIICSVLVCNNIMYLLITRKSCKIQLKLSGVALQQRSVL